MLAIVDEAQGPQCTKGVDNGSGRRFPHPKEHGNEAAVTLGARVSKHDISDFPNFQGNQYLDPVPQLCSHFEFILQASANDIQIIQIIQIYPAISSLIPVFPQTPALSLV